MRAPRRHRLRKRVIASPPYPTDLGALLSRVRYVGSPEHKDTTSFVGQPEPRADASRCPPKLAVNQQVIQNWLCKAIERGVIGAPFEGEAAFPRYVWYLEDGVVFEGRLVNRDAGSYKGYPLERDEWPAGIEHAYASV